MFKAVLRDTGGNILPLAAVGMLIAALVIGSAIDFARSYRTQNQLQAACDAAVLAGRKSVTTAGLDSTAITAARNYFAANYDDLVQNTSNTVFTPSSDDNGNTVEGTATTSLNTDVMKVFGYRVINLTATCASSMGVGNSDVMMVLDNTGSMGSSLGNTTRIAALRTAMNNFYTTLSTSTAGSNARIRYGFVPFSTTVNVGRLLYNLNPAYLRDSTTYQSREPEYRTEYSYGNSPNSSSSNTVYVNGTATTGLYNSSRYSSSTACSNAASSTPAETTFSNSGSATVTSSTTTNGSNQQVTTTISVQTQIKATSYYCSSRYLYANYATRIATTTTTDTYNPIATQVFDHWDYKPVAFDTSTFKTFASTSVPNGSSGASRSYTWNGCIHERDTVNQSSFSYSTLTGYSPSTAYDINIDMAPTTNVATQWAPMWPGIMYNRYNVTTNRWGQTSYTETTNTISTTEDFDQPSSPCPAAAQGLQTMTASAFSTYANAMVATGNTYLDTGIIWGGRLLSPDGIFATTVNQAPTNGGEVARHLIFMTDGIMEPNYTVNQAWGLEWWDRKITTDGSSNDASRHTSRFLAACAAIKDKGIRVWVIAFTASLSTDLTTCASPNSSYTASDAAGLNTAFQTIAKEVGELRVVQ
ncbi:pilus assembly protein TadG-related protein [Novosphingobium colocasiae]|uniref:VWFA domain-containing protein n=1 Tax=Novosphingobium colocasiae TaxID=1256513 RepID=A0A918PEH0_9SPHN|nr:pilus assembly protein TadG-related protein [Novosphingobium colocasiae]GGZ01952.1 hypothetical protein GCM10011614_16080 [Novosphingobium colocasiae]